MPYGKGTYGNKRGRPAKKNPVGSGFVSTAKADADARKRQKALDADFQKNLESAMANTKKKPAGGKTPAKRKPVVTARKAPTRASTRTRRTVSRRK